VLLTTYQKQRYPWIYPAFAPAPEEALDPRDHVPWRTRALAECYGGSIEDLGLKGFGVGHGDWKWSQAKEGVPKVAEFI
jgi:hypothetical protein